ncbi:CinA family protein [Bifidobacterium sp. ESL0798]|uniref:CinA family protein n=1 Tax=Bifidobacterium sp. ESL0798 TaxID=2983235 RepID=UPI0023F96CC9|nr:CinA family protein [Bifidobacterium sp. ESL0798]WEV74889.1 CinA family protein [Bifidobacterium sp. ESL0798]
MVSKGTEARIQPRCDELAARILDGAKVAGWKIAAAESLTGGLLADAFVRIPGASDVFLGSAVTYDINAKASVLGVDGDLLAQEGAVHSEVARQMALRTSRLYRQPQYGDRVLGLATTGVAGPGPDGDKPAGLVYIAVSVPAGIGADTRQTVAARLLLSGSREEVRHLTVLNALQLVTQLTTLTEE